MNSLYIIKDENNYPIGAAYEEHVAIAICQELNSNTKNGRGSYTYIQRPFFKEDTTQIKIISHAKVV
jgi:hypothetical protein